MTLLKRYVMHTQCCRQMLTISHACMHAATSPQRCERLTHLLHCICCIVSWTAASAIRRVLRSIINGCRGASGANALLPTALAGNVRNAIGRVRPLVSILSREPADLSLYFSHAWLIAIPRRD